MFFSNKRRRQKKEQEHLESELYRQIGQLKVELDWLKKRCPLKTSEKRMLIEPAHESLSIQHQCELLGVSRSGYYYHPRPESAQNLELMRLMDVQFMKTPFYGVRRMHQYLLGRGYVVNI